MELTAPMRAFLTDLREVLAKHQAQIESCSCCDGLWIEAPWEPGVAVMDLPSSNEPLLSVAIIDAALRDP